MGTANIRANITLGASGGIIGISATTAAEANGRNFTVDSLSTITGAGTLNINTYADTVTSNVNLFTLSGTNNYTGGTTWSTASAGDRLIIASATALGHSSGTLNLNSAFATVNLSNSISIGRLIGLAGSVITTETAGTKILSVGNTGTGNDDSSATFAGIIQNGSGILWLTKNGPNTQILSGTNTYTGQTTIQGGVLSVATINNGGVAGNLGAAANTANLIALRNGTLRFTGAAQNTDRLFSIGNNGGTLDASGSGAINFTNAGALTTYLSETGARTFTLTGTNTGNNILNPILGDYTGATSLVKSGIGKWVLSGVNTFTGVTTLTAGTLSVATIGNGGVAGNLGQASTAATNLVFNGGTLQYTGATASSNRAFTINNGMTATLEITTNNLSIAGATGTATNGGLTKTGAGTLTLTSANTYTGLTTVSAGTLAYGTNNVISTGAVTVNGATAVLALGANTDSVGTVTVAGGGSITGSGTLTSTGTFEMQSGSVSAILAGGGALTKSTVGAVTLTGANTYTGDTIVSEGSLVLSGGGSVASTTVNVASGATLNTTGVTGGTYTFVTGQTMNANGTITGNTIIEGTLNGNGTIIGNTVIQGTLAAGNSPGILSFTGNVTLDGSNSLFEIESGVPNRGVTYDGVNVTGLLTYDGTLTLSMASLIGNGTYNLFDFGSIAGTFDTGVVFSGPAYTGTFSYDGSNFYTATSNGQVFSFGLASGDLIVSAIPEPSTTLLLAGALTALVIFRRRRRD